MPTCTHACLPVYILACIQTNMSSYVSKNVRAHVHAHAHTHTNTQVHLVENVTGYDLKQRTKRQERPKGSGLGNC